MKAPFRCPKCRKPPIRYVEYLSGFRHTRDADSNGKPEKEGINSEGDSDHVTAHCGCGHAWKLRGLRHMGQVEERFGIPP